MIEMNSHGPSMWTCSYCANSGDVLRVEVGDVNTCGTGLEVEATEKVIWASVIFAGEAELASIWLTWVNNKLALLSSPVWPVYTISLAAQIQRGQVSASAVHGTSCITPLVVLTAHLLLFDLSCS
jgi:hypothetical protein